MKKEWLIFLGLFLAVQLFAQNQRIREHGIEIGVHKTGPYNAITDVQGVKVGHDRAVDALAGKVQEETAAGKGKIGQALGIRQ